MRVLLCTPIFPPEIGGPAIYTVEVARRLQKRGHRVRILAFTDTRPQLPDLEVIPVKIRYRILGTLFRQTRLFLTLLSAVKGMDLIYLQDPIVVGVTALLVGRMTGKPVVLKFVGDPVWEKEHSRCQTDQGLDDFLGSRRKKLALRLRLSLLRFVLGNMDRVIVPSFFLRDILIRYYLVRPDKIAVVYNSVDLLAMERATGEHRHRHGRQLIAVGRMVRHKRLEGIIKALNRLGDKFPDVTLMLVGDGPEREALEKLVEKLGVRQQVIFYGSTGYHKTLELLKESDVFILNSIYEGLPHTVIEAMACSVPVVATDIRGTDEVIENGRTGLLVPPDNEGALAARITGLLQDRELSRRLTKNALTSVKNKFTWETNLVKLETELKKVI